MEVVGTYMEKEVDFFIHVLDYLLLLVLALRACLPW